MNKGLRAIVIVLAVAFLAASAWLALALFLPLVTVWDATSPLPCAPPPASFSPADLVGMWSAGSPDQRDTLTIRPDGTYKQAVHIEFTSLPAVDYESDWQEWWLEPRDNGTIYLHLEGFRMCGFNPEISCTQRGASGHDFCRNASIPLSDDGVILVLGAPRPAISLPGDTFAPRGITLWFPVGSENTWAYDLQEP